MAHHITMHLPAPYASALTSKGALPGVPDTPTGGEAGVFGTPSVPSVPLHNQLCTYMHVSCVETHVLGHVLQGVEHSVHGVDVGKLHELAVGKHAVLVKLAAAQRGLCRGGGAAAAAAGRRVGKSMMGLQQRRRRGPRWRPAHNMHAPLSRCAQLSTTPCTTRTKDVEGGHPHAQADLSACLSQALGDGPAKALQERGAQRGCCSRGVSILGAEQEMDAWRWNSRSPAGDGGHGRCRRWGRPLQALQPAYRLQPREQEARFGKSDASRRCQHAGEQDQPSPAWLHPSQDRASREAAGKLAGACTNGAASALDPANFIAPASTQS